MSLKVTSALLAAVLVAGFIVQPAATQMSQTNNGTIPMKYPAKILPRSDTICPSTEERETTFAEIDQEINALIRNTVLPEFDICPGIYPQNPAASCLKIAECDPSLPSGYYWINTTTQVYCDMDRQGCNSTGGWTRVAYLNMTDPTQQCPSAWREITSPIRTCGRDTNHSGCDTVIFSTNGIQYSNVMGRVVGYQYGNPEAFADTDVDGVMITQATLTRHIWSFAAERNDNSYCPCSTTHTAPAFFGEDYFCESATVSSVSGIVFHEDDPLWDGQGCGANPTCCTYNNPPWFCKQLSQATTDDLEISICTNGNHLANEDTPIELIEIFIQ